MKRIGMTLTEVGDDGVERVVTTGGYLIESPEDLEALWASVGMNFNTEDGTDG